MIAISRKYIYIYTLCLVWLVMSPLRSNGNSESNTLKIQLIFEHSCEYFVTLEQDNFIQNGCLDTKGKTNIVQFNNVKLGKAKISISNFMMSFSNWHFYEKSFNITNNMIIPVSFPTNKIEITVDFKDEAPTVSLFGEQTVARIFREETLTEHGYLVWVYLKHGNNGTYKGSVVGCPQGLLDISFAKASLEYTNSNIQLVRSIKYNHQNLKDNIFVRENEASGKFQPLTSGSVGVTHKPAPRSISRLLLNETQP